MQSKNPVAFLSYVRDDDAHDLGSVTKFRERLEGEIKVQSGQRFEIFQDRNDIRWGQVWQERIIESLTDATFLIPIITPSFLVSPACRMEVETFLRVEQTIGISKLILPVYYVSCDAIESNNERDKLIVEIRKRNWTDWRSFRFTPFDDPSMRAAIAKLATSVKLATQELASVAEAANKPKQVTTVSRAVVVEEKAEANPASRRPTNPPWSKNGDPALIPPADEPYWAFTLEFDQVIPASKLIGDAEEAIQLQAVLAREVASIKKRYSDLFQSIRTTPIQPNTVVTVLIDNSGSMRGKPITLAAAWTVILSEWFNNAGIEHEILGYTTRSWKGGQARQKWLDAGKKWLPGRLCDLRHIIYKSFDEPASGVAANCAIMMREGLLKENIDGEALLWACARLELQEAQRRLLFVMSDGAPIDDATLSANPADFLAKHLIAAAASIEKGKLVSLKAVGLNFDNPYYSDSQIVDREDVGAPILEHVFGVSFREIRRVLTKEKNPFDVD
jgi:cobaltochelatase CobT